MRKTIRTALCIALLSAVAFSVTAQDAEAPVAEQTEQPAMEQPTTDMQQPATEQPAMAQPSVTEAPSPAANPLPAGLSAPADGMGQIVFFRPSKFTGAAIGYKVREGDTELGKLRNGTYFVLQVAPGEHSYVVHSEAKDVLTLEVDAGETYYVQGGISLGVFAGRPNLSPSTAEAFAEAAKKLKPAKPLD